MELPLGARSAIRPQGPDTLPTSPLAARAREFAQASHAAATRRAYRADFLDFERWCLRTWTSPLPASPNIVALYIADLAERVRARTIARRIVAIGLAHRAAGFDNPAKDAGVQMVLSGIKRSLGMAQTGKAAMRLIDLRVVLNVMDSDSLRDVRDRALLLVGFAGALRRSELVAIQVADIEFCAEGAVLTIRKSKTDQLGETEIVGLPYGSQLLTCPVRALQKWIADSHFSCGPIFRSVNRHGRILDAALTGDSVARIVKDRASVAGLDGSRYAAHSLRSGFVTEAAAHGITDRDIMAQTRHVSSDVMRRYIRYGSVWERNACCHVGL